MSEDYKKVEFKTFTNIDLKDKEDDLDILKESNRDKLYFQDSFESERAFAHTIRLKDEKELQIFRNKLINREEKLQIQVGVKEKKEMKNLINTQLKIIKKRKKVDEDNNFDYCKNIEATAQVNMPTVDTVTSALSSYLCDYGEDSD